jgi:hypothetical protein
VTHDDILARADEFADRFERDYTPTVDTSTPEMWRRRERYVDEFGNVWRRTHDGLAFVRTKD